MLPWNERDPSYRQNESRPHASNKQSFAHYSSPVRFCSRASLSSIPQHFHIAPTPGIVDLILTVGQKITRNPQLLVSSDTLFGHLSPLGHLKVEGSHTIEQLL